MLSNINHDKRTNHAKGIIQYKEMTQKGGDNQYYRKDSMNIE